MGKARLVRNIGRHPGVIEDTSQIDPLPMFGGGTHGSVIIRSHDRWNWIGPGSDNDVLESQGVNKDPRWVTPSGGGAVVGESRTISTTAPITGGGDLSANRTFALTYGTPSNIGTANAAGSAASLVRSDHVHDHVGSLGANLHHTQDHVSRHRAEGADELPINVIAGVAFGQVVGTTIQSNSKNLASVSNTATGVYEVSFTTDFDDVNYAVLVTPDSTLPRFATAAGHGAGSVFVYIRDEDGTVQNTNFQILAIGNW